MKLLILTTALNRSDLHRKSFYSIQHVIDKSQEIIWVINIDALSILNERPEKTEALIREMFSDYRNIKFIFNKFDGGNFIKSVKTLAKEASKVIGDVDYVFYWEDDYIATKSLNLLKVIKKIKKKRGEFLINLARKKLPSNKKVFCFQPTIWTPNMFKGYINAFNALSSDYDKCPEVFFSRHYTKFTPVKKFSVRNFKMFAGYLIGRRWMSKRGVTKSGNDYIIESNADNVFTVAGYRHDVDKVVEHDYDTYYSMFLPSDPNKGGAMLEIGIDEGRSLKMWRDIYPHVKIYGIDLDKSFSGKDIFIYNVDQSDKKALNTLAKKLPKMFFICDDGSHVPEHQLLTFNALFPILGNEGVYIIEDIETSYWERGRLYKYDLEYGYKHKDSIIEIFKDVADGVNSDILGEVKTDRVKHQELIESVTFGRNCIIIRKKFPKYVNYKFKNRIKKANKKRPKVNKKEKNKKGN